jgi:hypothetical protein
MCENSLEYGWTKTHGFFAIMVGFMLFKGDKPDHIIKPHELKQYICQINITKEEIDDKSKRDLISKVFLIGQTGWFVLQCIMRRVEHLPLTKLELVTLGFTSLNFVIYLIWWKKPIDVGQSYPVSREIQVKESKDTGCCSGLRFTMFKKMICLSKTPQPSSQLPSRQLFRQLSQPSPDSKFSSLATVVLWFMKSSGLYVNMGWEDVEREVKRVPSWYAGREEKWDNDAENLKHAGFVAAAISCIDLINV